MKKQITLVSILAAGLMVLSACAEYDYFRILERSSSNVPQDIAEDAVNAPAGAADPSLDYFNVTNNWMQPNNQVLTKPEIVFVIDTSGSMTNEVQALQNSILGWVGQLQSQNVNEYCLSVMRSHAGTNSEGKLISASGNNKCICTYGANSVSSADAVTLFSQNLGEALNNTSGGGAVEAPFVSISTALNDPAVLAANRAEGCFRDDAALVVIPVSDENATCYAPDNGAVMFENEFFLGAGNSFSNSQSSPFYAGGADGQEAGIRRDFCTDGVLNGAGKYVNNLTHETVIADIQAYNNDLPSFGAAIGYNPGANGGDPFWGGMSFANAFGQNLVDMQDSVDNDDAAFQASMNEMADALVQEISFYDSFTLSDTICDVDGDSSFLDEEAYVTVQVNGATIDPANWAINATGNKIIFNQSFTWSANAAIEVKYLRCE